MVRDDLLEGRRRRSRRGRARRPPSASPRSELGSWLTATNDLRLVLGTRLDVTEDTQG